MGNLTDIDKLRALAEAATSAPAVCRSCGRPEGNHRMRHLFVGEHSKSNAVRVLAAALNPTAVLALLDELAALRKVAEAAESDGHMVAVARVAESLGIDEDAERLVSRALNARSDAHKGRRLRPAPTLTAEDVEALEFARQALSVSSLARQPLAVLDRIIEAHKEQG